MPNAAAPRSHTLTYAMNDNEFEAVLALDNVARFDHFVKRVADWQQAWGTRNADGWLVPAAPEGFEYFPIWPHPDYAQRITDAHFPGCSATEITLEELMDDWLPMLEKEGVKVAVFPGRDWSFWCMEPADLSEALQNELARYE